jgi:hypothetical protein
MRLIRRLAPLVLASSFALAAQDFSGASFARTAIDYAERGDLLTAWSFMPLAASGEIPDELFRSLERITVERIEMLIAEGDPLLLDEIRSFVDDHPRFATGPVMEALASGNSPASKAKAIALADAALAKAATAYKAVAFDPDGDPIASPWENEFRRRLRALPGPKPESFLPREGVDPLALIVGLGFLALVASGAGFTAIKARNARYAEEQRKQTSEALLGMRDSPPPVAPPDRAPAAPDAAAAQLAEKCTAYAIDIERATGRPGSSRAVAALVWNIAKEIGIDEAEAHRWYCAALVYDIGFLSVDADILKAASIGEEEFQAIREHPKLGLNRIFFVPPESRELFRDCVLKHHENLDGSGYPSMLQAPSIPPIARAVRAAESFLAIVSGRGRGERLEPSAAIEELMANVGTYDREIVLALERARAARSA